MTTSRLETFSDGVFAIAATLLILNVRVDGSRLG
ncbi:MAG: TMEM175 family protein, partial [Acidimicrobiales bacterium]